MIRILANLYKSRGETSPVLTAADFRLDDDASGIGALLDSVANEHHRRLRAKAQQNILSVAEAVPDQAQAVPHLHEVLSALWLRSIAIGHLAGAEAASLQIDVTRAQPIDDNAFQVELATIVENSFNVHQDGARLVFREEENPLARLLACARNDKLFTDGADQGQLARELRYVIGGTDEVVRTFRVIALPKSWQTDPWGAVEEGERPERWDERLPILVLPEEPEPLDQRLGTWLKDRLQSRRNTLRFLLPRAGAANLYLDRELVILARMVLKAQEWSAQNPEYRKLQTKYQAELRDLLKKRFDRFAVLARWDYVNPGQCRFSVEALRKQGAQIPQAIEETLVNDLFVPEDFTELVLESAAANKSLGQLLRELQEPRPGGKDCIPWLGETAMKERVLRLCARGQIAINLRGLEYAQAQPGEDEETAWTRLRAKLPYTGRQLDEVSLMVPGAVSVTGGIVPPPIDPPVGGNGGTGGDTETPTPGDPTPGPDEQTPPPGGIFGGGAKARTPLHYDANSALNLMGRLEGDGIGPATQVAAVSLRLSSATGAQLKDLLKKLPDGLTFELSLEKEDG